MKITTIEEFSKTKCMLIFEDLSTLVLYKKDLKKYHLTEGEELSNGQLEAFRQEILPYRAKARCMKLLQSKDYTEWEMRKKLQGDGYPSEVIDMAVEYLYSYKYLDDKKYVRLYYQSRCLRKSKKQIEIDLQRKGISKEVINVILDAYIGENGADEELQCINKLLLKRKYDDEVADLTEREKIKAYLFRKGFQMEHINKCMHNFSWKNM